MYDKCLIKKFDLKIVNVLFKLRFIIIKKYRYIILKDEIKLAKYIINNFKLSIFQKIKLLQNILKVFIKFLFKIIF